MGALTLRIRAPFAAFRPFQAGSYRSTTPVMPPSAAYGLVMNVAGIDVRDTERSPTGMRVDAPSCQIAVGLVRPADLFVLYQQLHSYPVGSSGKELALRTYGAKYWIAPGKREALCGYDGVIALRELGDAILSRVRDAIAGRPHGPRYGLPFLGDNNFLVDRIEESNDEAEWYVPCDAAHAPVRRSCRLTVSIDREDSARTKTRLFAPVGRGVAPPEAAFVSVPFL